MITFSTNVLTTSRCPPAAARMSEVKPVSDMTLGSALHHSASVNSGDQRSRAKFTDSSFVTSVASDVPRTFV